MIQGGAPAAAVRMFETLNASVATSVRGGREALANRHGTAVGR